MRKIKLTNYPRYNNDKIKSIVCFLNPVYEYLTLCGTDTGGYDEQKDTTEPITCPDCLAIIRECQEIKFDWQDSLGQLPDEFRKPKPDPNTESLLHECCLALGWSGGTRAQVLQVLRSAKKFLVETAKNENSGYVKAYQELKQLIG